MNSLQMGTWIFLFPEGGEEVLKESTCTQYFTYYIELCVYKGEFYVTMYSGP